jgi:threonylcarbamoyladenosine tRNA methylthiotransferase MtaB
MSEKFRIRISSLEPDGFGPNFHKLFQHPKMAPHLHLCIQSGSDPILLKMRRMYTTSSFMEIIEQFRKEIPDFNFTTDVIVGFPGESDLDFKKTVQVVEEAKFSHVHTFRYSRRKGTRADRMENQVEERTKTERSEVIRTVAEQSRRLFLNSMVGKEQQVLIEKVNQDGMAYGYGEHYLPVSFAVDNPLTNRFQRVHLEGLTGSDPLGLKGSSLT